MPHTNNGNNQPCSDYIDKYPLTAEVYVRICQVDGNITIDIPQVEIKEILKRH